MKNLKLLSFLFALLVYGCTTVQHVSKMEVSYDVPAAQTNPATDDAIEEMIAPYKSQLDSKMNVVVANLATELTKKQPESTMGNWFTDALMDGVERAGLSADFAINNYGGMRVPVITAGPLTVEEIYELAPFDNMLMIVDVPGNMVDTFFQYIAVRNGWPVSGNIRMTIKNENVMSCLVNGQSVDPDKTYRVAMPDYVANGGDDASFFVGLKRLQTGLLMRDLLIEYARETAAKGMDIQVFLEGRIIKL